MFTNASRPAATRPLVALAAAALLAAGSVAAVTADVHAAKPLPPTIEYNGDATCAPLAPSGFMLTATFTVNGGTGRWVYYTSEFGETDGWGPDATAGTRDVREMGVEASEIVSGASTKAAYRVTLTDNKGNALGDPGTVAETGWVDCPA